MSSEARFRAAHRAFDRSREEGDVDCPDREAALTKAAEEATDEAMKDAEKVCVALANEHDIGGREIFEWVADLVTGAMTADEFKAAMVNAADGILYHENVDRIHREWSK